MNDPYDLRTMPREDLRRWVEDEYEGPVCPDCADSADADEPVDPSCYPDGVTCCGCQRKAQHDGSEADPGPDGPARSAEADDSTEASESDEDARFRAAAEQVTRDREADEDEDEPNDAPRALVSFTEGGRLCQVSEGEAGGFDAWVGGELIGEGYTTEDAAREGCVDAVSEMVDARRLRFADASPYHDDPSRPARERARAWLDAYEGTNYTHANGARTVLRALLADTSTDAAPAPTGGDTTQLRALIEEAERLGNDSQMNTEAGDLFAPADSHYLATTLASLARAARRLLNS